MLDVRRMRVLREVAQRGSFSAAAESLSYTQSAVSQHVAALERETGAKLVDRGPRGIRLTDAGRALVRHADAVLARLEDAEQELAAIAGLRGGRLRLGSFPSAGATLVPQAVARFHERHPDVDLGMVEVEPVDAIQRLKLGEIDLALVYDFAASTLPHDDELELVHLLDDRMDLVLPREHPLAEGDSVRLTALSDDAWVGGTARDSCGVMLVRACESSGFVPRVTFETDDYQAAQAFVAAGMGVTMLPRLALRTLHPDVVVRPIGKGAPVRRIMAAFAAGSYRSPASEAMLAILREVAEEFRRPALVAVA